MDPLTIVSLAAAVAQFTDLGVRLLSETVQVYKSTSGMASQAVELKTIEDNLRQLCQFIQEKSAPLADPRKPLNESERNLLRLCGTCRELSDELAGVVDRLQTHRKGGLNLAIESFGVTMKKFWSRDYIADLRRRVSDTRQQMMLAMMVFLWENSKSEAKYLDQLSRQQAETISTLARIDDTTHTLHQTLVNFLERSPSAYPSAETHNASIEVFEYSGNPQLQGSSQADQRQRKIIETIWSSSWSPRQPIQDFSYEDIEFPEVDSSINNDAACSKAILNSLFDKELRYREVAISETYKSTFQWLLNSPRSDAQGRPLWSDFTAWLRNSNTDIYWMTGKPGSGKSTLMKFIISHPILRELLDQWSGAKQCILAMFYFWNAGTSLQRSQEGLLRALLYQCLTQQPQLIPKVCPRRWALFRVFGSKAVKVAPRWDSEELHESFSAFDLLVGEQFNFALFIDGLDEFDGDHQTLLNFVRLFHSRVGRKVCVSSRPWNVFQDAFATNPSLRLELLTVSDIRFYVQDSLESSPGFQEYKGARPNPSNDLVETIVTKAQGVFLWVSVVVLSILIGLSEGDQWQELCDMVNLLPVDLLQLYHRIWSTIKPDHVSQASHLFQIHEAYAGPIDVITMWLADHADHADPLQIDIDISNPDQKTLITRKMRRRLNSRTRGLLEISPNSKIEFLHKSVRDWIESFWADIVAKSKQAFDPNFCIFKAETFKFWYFSYHRDRGRGTDSDLGAGPWRSFLGCFSYAARVHHTESNTSALVTTLDRLHAAIDHYAESYPPLSTSPRAWKRASYDIKRLLHWSTTEDQNTSESRFVGLAAQYGIFGYVRDKVTANPGLLQRSPSEGSILANAVLWRGIFQKLWPIEGPLAPGVYEVFEPAYPSDIHISPRSESYGKYLLIKFLLDLGVPKSSARAPGVRTSLYREARGRPVKMPPIVKPDGQQLDYWDTVTKLLEEYGLSRVGIL